MFMYYKFFNLPLMYKVMRLATTNRHVAKTVFSFLPRPQAGKIQTDSFKGSELCPFHSTFLPICFQSQPSKAVVAGRSKRQKALRV